MKFRGLKFLLFVILIYIGLFFYDSNRAILAFKKSIILFIDILPIFMVVIIFTAIIDYFFNPKKFSKYFSKGSGFKGWIFSLLLGVISHGPMYAWYPMIENLKKHGLKNGYIATFLYSRSIKLPLLPLMIDYFGWKFTFVLTFYILLASLLQGVFIDKVLKI